MTLATIFFKNLKVLELASVLAGPSVGQFFAELGAEVIKIENPETNGDVTRSWLAKDEQDRKGRSAYFCAGNWGKQSLAINLNTEEGQSIVKELAKQSDIILSSYKVGDAEKFGLDYQSLSLINPALIYGHIVGYGADDPRVGYDALIQAESGLMSINGEPGSDGLKLPIAFIDILAAHHLKEAILIALINRQFESKGVYIPVSLFDCAVQSLANQGTNHLMNNSLAKPMGNEHPNIVPYGGVYKTMDNRKIMVAIGGNQQFKSFCEILTLSIYDKFADNKFRVEKREELNAILANRIKELEADFILNQCNKLRIPVGELRNISEVFSEPEIRNSLLKSDAFPAAFGLPSLAVSIGLSSTSRLLPPPILGEHSETILIDKLNYSNKYINILKSSRIVF
ncbi:CaiB/BaiF CoA transferase family protein [Fulvivirgaceae bacterium LMO-SS25]